jgi:hypothetical protein
VDARGDILDAADLLANRFRVSAGQRGSRPEPRGRITQPLPRSRVIVLFHRVVFGMIRSEDYIWSGLMVLGLMSRLMIHDAATVVGHCRLVIARRDDDDVEARRHDLLLNRGLRAPAKCRRRHHGADADRHAEHRQCSLEAVARQRAQGDVKAEAIIHGGLCAAPRSAVTGAPSLQVPARRCAGRC